MIFNKTFIFCGANKFDFVNDKQERVCGCKVHVVSTDKRTDTHFGFEVDKVTAPLDLWGKLITLPINKPVEFEVDINPRYGNMKILNVIKPV